MMPSLSHRRTHYALLIALSALLFLTNLGGASLWDLDEGRNAACAQAMKSSENYVVPTFNGEMRNHKPVLQYWLQAAAYHLFGVNEFAARLPSALAAMLTVLLCYELGRSMFGKTTGLLAGLVVAGTPMLIAAARFANPDALLSFSLVFTLWSFWNCQQRPTAFWHSLVGAGVGLALLAKGPVGVVLPVAIVFCFALWERRFDLLWNRRVPFAWLATFVVAGPWYIWVIAETKARFIREFLMTHNVDRFLNPMENHRGNPLYYVIVLLVGLAPWSVFLLMAVWLGFWSAVRNPWPRFERLWQWAHDERARGDDSAYRFLVVWAVLYVAFFTVAATKLPFYVLPVVVPCAVLIARLLERWRLGLLDMPRWFMPQVFWALLLGSLLTAAGLIVGSGVVYDFAFLRGRRFPELLPLAVSAPILLVAVVLAWRYHRQGRRTALITAFAVLFSACMVPIGAWASAALNAYKSPQGVAEILKDLTTDAEYELVGWQVEHLPSLNFYLKRDITHIETVKQLSDYLAYPMPVYAIVAENRWSEFRAEHPALGRELGRRPDLYKGRAVVVVTNRAK